MRAWVWHELGLGCAEASEVHAWLGLGEGSLGSAQINI